jgi:hypothetical protein
MDLSRRFRSGAAVSTSLSAQELVDFGRREKCLMLRERFGISYVMAGVDALAFAPVVERLAGR